MHNNVISHPSHKTEISKLDRAIGQLEGVKKMIEDQRYCVELLHN